MKDTHLKFQVGDVYYYAGDAATPGLVIHLDEIEMIRIVIFNGNLTIVPGIFLRSHHLVVQSMGR